MTTCHGCSTKVLLRLPDFTLKIGDTFAEMLRPGIAWEVVDIMETGDRQVVSLMSGNDYATVYADALLHPAGIWTRCEARA